MITLQLVGANPVSNPDRFVFQATFSGTYGANGGVGDALNLTPFQSSSNTTGFTDPYELLGEELVANPAVPPGVFAEQLAGGYVQAYLGSSLNNAYLRCYAANGTELTQGAAYPANFLSGQAVLEILLPLRTGE